MKYPSKIAIIAIVLLAGLFVSSGQASALYTNAQLNCTSTNKNDCLESGTATAYAWDQSCKSHMNTYKNSSTYNMREIINGVPPGGGAGAYGQSSWLSQRNYARTTSPTAVTYNSTTVPLQINSISFLCGPMVTSDNGLSTTNNVPASPHIQTVLNQTARWVTTSDTRDQDPNSVGGANLRPARTGLFSRIGSLSVATNPAVAGDSITGGAGQSISISRDETSRYWFANPVQTIAYNDPAGIKTARTITVTMVYKSIARYSGNIHMCKDLNGSGSHQVSSSTDFSSCGNVTDTLTLQIAPGPSNAPTGTLTLSCASNYTVNAVANFSDPDGATDAYIKYGTFTSTRSATKPRTFTGIPSGSSITLYVKNVPGTADVAVATGTRTCTPPPPGPGPSPPPPIPCPVGSQNTTPDITLPPAPLPSRPGATVSSSAPTGSQGNSNAVWYHEVAQNRYRINDAYDQYGQRVTWTDTGFQSTNQFRLNYQNYVLEYPYDLHNTTVLYSQEFREQKYVADSSSPIYNCPNGGSYNGSTSKCEYPASVSYSCPSGQYPSGSTCYDNNTNANMGPATASYYCPSGGTLSMTTCSYPPTVTYPWITSGGTITVTSDSNTPGEVLDQCYYRGVQILPEPDTHVNNTYVDDEEDPRSIRFEATGAVIFDKDPSAPASANNTPRQPNRATLAYEVHPFYSSDPNALDGNAIPSCPDDSGSMVMTAASFAQTVSQVTSQTACNDTFAPPMEVGDYFCVRYTFTLVSDQVNRNGGFQGSNNQEYITTSCQSPITNQPYARFFGADVSAGGKFASATGDCSGGATFGGIRAFIKPSPTAPARGSGAQFGARSLGSVNGFASAAVRDFIPRAGTGLTFANTPGGTRGNFNITPPCIHNYYADRPSITESGPIATNGIHKYGFNSNTTLPGFNLSSGANIAIYVNGDINITDDITFDTTWATTDDVPTLYVIASGNIFISRTVRELNGVYVAQQNGGSGGTIDTCALSVGEDRYSECNRQLKVYGSFVAKRIQFNRAFASLRNAVAGETPGPTGDCSTNGEGQLGRGFDCAAETFYFLPEAFLGKPAVPARSGPATGKVDYITSLSPIL